MLAYALAYALCISIMPRLVWAEASARLPPDVNVAVTPINRAQKQHNLEELIEEAERGQYAIRRVEFCCNLRTDVFLLTRKSLLVEGEVFTRELLERGLKSLSGLKSVRPVKLRDVEVRLHEEHKEIDISITLMEKRPARARVKRL